MNTITIYRNMISTIILLKSIVFKIFIRNDKFTSIFKQSILESNLQHESFIKCYYL